VDLEIGAIVAVTTHGGAAADTATVEGTVIEAGVAVAELLTAESPQGRYAVHLGGVEEVVADKGYHSNEVAVRLGELKVRTYIAEPNRGARNWEGKQAEKEAVYGVRCQCHSATHIHLNRRTSGWPRSDCHIGVALKPLSGKRCRLPVPCRPPAGSRSSRSPARLRPLVPDQLRWPLFS
jgi:transposase